MKKCEFCNSSNEECTIIVHYTIQCPANKADTRIYSTCLKCAREELEILKTQKVDLVLILKFIGRGFKLEEQWRSNES